MNRERKFKLCGVLKKYDCVNLIRNNFKIEDLKALINPNFEQLIKILNCLTKKELQYIVFNSEKIGIERITNEVRTSAVKENNNIDKNFFNENGDMQSDDEEINNDEENITDDIQAKETTKPIKNVSFIENKKPKNNESSIIIYEKKNEQDNNGENTNNDIKEIHVGINAVSDDIIQLNADEETEQKQKTKKITENKLDNSLTMSNVEVCYDYEKVLLFLKENGLTVEEIKSFFLMNAKKIRKKISFLSSNKLITNELYTKTLTADVKTLYSVAFTKRNIM